MREPVFTGVCTALVTPFTHSGAVHYDQFARLIDRQLEGGVDAVCVCGTTGESATLSHDEHTECIRYTVRRVAGRVPVVAGTGSNDTAYAIKLSQQAEADGADALLLARLGERERRILALRFYDGKTQMEVASEINISQAQVSRLEKHALKVMRQYLNG